MCDNKGTRLQPRLIQAYDDVQRLLAAANFAGEKQRIHHHYPKGSISCGKENAAEDECGCRLIVCNAKSRSDRIHPYFVCIGRNETRGAARRKRCESTPSKRPSATSTGT